MAQSFTIQDIADAHGATWHQVYHAMRRLEVKAVGSVGGTKVYDRAALRQVGGWLKKNDRVKLGRSDAREGAGV